MIWTWLGFFVLIGLLLSLDLGWLSKRPHVMSFREALLWSAAWVGVALAFTVLVYGGYEHHWFGLGTKIDAVDGRVNDGLSATAKYLAGYVLEKALSIDNLFVIAVIFKFLGVPAGEQHRVLSWGIIGAMVLRGALIAVGVELVAHYHWVLYVFGAFLLYTGLRMLVTHDRDPDPAKSLGVRLARRVLPLTPNFDGKHFVTREAGRLVLTPLALAMILVEGADVMFATDSIPAIFAVTADPLLVFTSNIFAVLGLRTLYFALVGLMARFEYLKVSLALILMLVGFKIIASHWIKALMGQYTTVALLLVVGLLIAAGVIASLVVSSRNQRAEAASSSETESPSDAVRL
jgi:tellurite resistance protein TerC